MSAEEIRAIYERMADIRSGEVPSMVGNGLVGGGRVRTCARKKKVYSKALGEKVERCAKYKPSARKPRKSSVRKPRKSRSKGCTCPPCKAAESIKEAVDDIQKVASEVAIAAEVAASPAASPAEKQEAADIAIKAVQEAEAVKVEAEVAKEEVTAAGLVGGCMECMGSGKYFSCNKFKKVPSVYGHPVKRCSSYGASMVGGTGMGGTRANKRAAAKSPWLAFVRAYALEHPELAHDRPMLLHKASKAYRAGLECL